MRTLRSVVWLATITICPLALNHQLGHLYTIVPPNRKHYTHIVRDDYNFTVTHRLRTYQHSGTVYANLFCAYTQYLQTNIRHSAYSTHPYVPRLAIASPEFGWLWRLHLRSTTDHHNQPIPVPAYYVHNFPSTSHVTHMNNEWLNRARAQNRLEHALLRWWMKKMLRPLPLYHNQQTT